jgi:hypothetical protein
MRPSTVLALVALFVALAGTGVAAVQLPGGPATLGKGQTLRGVYFVGSSSAAGNQLATGGISFPVALPRPPVAHFVRRGAVRPAACRGTAERPTAAPGHLCVYEAREQQAGEHRILDPVTGKLGGARVWGTALAIRSIRGGDVFSAGTWAVTAR